MMGRCSESRLYREKILPLSGSLAEIITGWVACSADIRRDSLVEATQRTNELLDHILTSQGLMPRLNGLRQVPTMSILNEDTPNMIGSHPIVSGVVPDHAPVTATFV